MKKIIITTIAAVAAILALSSFAGTTGTSDGTVSFEAASAPALNCTLSMQNAAGIYRLLPENLAECARKEYTGIRQKSRSRSHFTHDGVDIRIKDAGATLDIVFTLNGYKVKVCDVTWETLDNLFAASEAER